MISVFYFSGNGHSRTVAEYIAKELNCDCVDICVPESSAQSFETAVAVFPVYCQNIPKPVKAFLKMLDAKNVALLATYGKISCGNVLFEAEKLVKGRVIAGAYVPTGHSFLNGKAEFDKNALLMLCERIKSPIAITVPKRTKHVFANLFPAWRSRIGVRIKKNGSCDGCGMCDAVCPMNAMRLGTPNSKCIRCLKCVSSCPQKALKFENSFVLNKYLMGHCFDELIVYL